MPRAALSGLAALLLASGMAAAPLDPHVDPSRLPLGCPACHRGHGASRSPMLPGSQTATCLGCHGTRGGLEQQVRNGLVTAGTQPALLAGVLARPFSHPLNARAFSESEPGAVVCTSCHAPHRAGREPRERSFPAGRRLLSPKDPRRFEYQLCQDCHGGGGPRLPGLAGVAPLFDPDNRSYHPVQAPARDSSPSLPPELRGIEINCTECHGNDDPAGPRGPHGSNQPFLLRARYTTIDGGGPTATAHALCYLCHRAEAVRTSPLFREHERHVGAVGASCATCHDPHGSLGNRALIRFGEAAFVAGVSPSLSTGRLEFVSDAPGSGLCYLTCHGRDHAPEGYGAAADPLRRRPVAARP